MASRILPLKAFVAEVASLRPPTQLIALDFGTKTVGVACCDETRIAVTPLGNIAVRQPYRSAESLRQLKAQLQALGRTRGLRHFVVGFPLTLDGDLSPLCHRIVWTLQHLPSTDVDALSGKFDSGNSTGRGSSGETSESGTDVLTFCLWDEAFTTAQARRAIKATSTKRRVLLKHKDSVAAGNILRSFLDHWTELRADDAVR